MTKTYTGTSDQSSDGSNIAKSQVPALPSSTSSTVSPGPKSGETGRQHGNLRRELYGLLDAYRMHTDTARVARCGLRRCAPNVAVLMGEADKRGQLAGIIRCRCKVCPPCLARRRADYADQIARVADLWWEKQQPTQQVMDLLQVVEADQKARVSSPFWLLTFTIRHGRKMPLKVTGRGVRACWRKLIGGRAWQKLRAELGCEYIVAEEVTYGENGWHPHLHVLLLPSRNIDEDERIELSWELYERWATIVERELGADCVPSQARGVDLRRIGVASYLSKTVGIELANPDTTATIGLELADPVGAKRGRKGGSRTPMQLLRDWRYRGDRHALRKYREYERALKGRKDITWSKGLKSLRNIAGAEAKREQRAAMADAKPVALLDGLVWDKWRQTPNAHALLLESAETFGLQGVRTLIASTLGEWTRALVSETGTPDQWQPAYLQRPREARGPPQRLRWSLPLAAEL